MRWIPAVLAVCLPTAAESPPASPTAVSALDAAGAVAPESAEFRAFPAPAPLVSPGPATRPRQGRCRPGVMADASELQPISYETARQRAALDAALRADGGMLLPAQELHDEEHRLPGSILRGRLGERWLVVAERSAVSDPMPLVAIDAARNVFVVQPAAKAATKRTITLCGPICAGGGWPGPRAWVVVEVPAGARLTAMRDVRYPIDVEVVFTSRQRCVPRP